jgi:predicted transcriptional regulator
MNDFYELRDDVSTAVNTFNKLKKEGTPEERKEYREKNQELLRVKSSVNNMNNVLTKIREQEKRIYNNRTMSGEEKRVKLEEIRQRQEKVLANVAKLRLRAGF